MTNEQLAVLLQSYLTHLEEGMFMVREALPETLERSDGALFASWKGDFLVLDELNNLRDDLLEAVQLLGGEQA